MILFSYVVEMGFHIMTVCSFTVILKITPPYKYRL